MDLQTFTSEALFAPITSSPKLQIARSIARYGLFEFLNSNRSSSDLYPLIESLLPLEIKKTKETLIKPTPTRSKNLKWKTRALQGLGSGLGLILPSVLKTTGDVFHSPGSLLLDTLRSVGSSGVLVDPNWGTATVKTESFHGDLAWSTILSVGTPAQMFRLNLDSGSSDLFLFDQACKTCSTTNHTTFKPDQSTSFTSTPLSENKFDQTFGDGSTVSGELVKDTVSIGNSIKAYNQTFGLATMVSSDWAELPVDGLMGIGPDPLSVFTTNDPKGVFTNLVNSQTLDQPIIGIALVKELEYDSGSALGEFKFGGISKKWIREDLVWKNVTSHNFWGVDLTGIYVNGSNVMSPNDPPRAILDTGTTLTLVSETTAAEIHKRIPGSVVDPDNGIWMVPCSTHNPSNKKSTYNRSDHTSPGPLDSKSLIPVKTVSPPHGHSLPLNLKKRSHTSNQFYSRHHRKHHLHARSSPTSTPASPNIFFEFGIGSLQFVIPAEDLAYQSILNEPRTDDQSGICYSGIQSGSEGFVVLGDTFIKNQYLALRYETNGQRSVGLSRRTDLPILT
ncbi:aspartic peptidase A1 [Melampsora larici-populina 98AG31]|uniref:Aspartic peptidase A1 n=1 Tax=Melampsora larici-populina (strain 98AG31 / pathotype 3-4-7) TaxID=747676 RepID=F4RRT1_MELLP|nr:aspartic peptidase A1 [Melampsora larici-populina 98AG31]EGG04901.1 aspartic peptidase A1 [Melampsora larici-populina 98AG31]